MTAEQFDISVIIPSKNEGHKIRKCLDGILSQSVKPREIIVIDSGSTDGTQDIVRGYNDVTLVEIPPNEFNHGGTRNKGAKMAKGEYLLFTVQDSRAFNKDWIKNLMTGFVNDDVVAVSGSQVVPHEKDANPVEWFKQYSEPKVATYSFTTEEFNALTPAEQRSVCGFDNVNSIYIRDVLIEHPFAEVMEAEDIKWAKDMYLKGYTLSFNPGARVYHYHTESSNYFYKRTLLVSYIGYDHFKLIPDIPKQTLKQKLSILKSIFTAKGLSVSEKLKWVDYNKMAFNSIKKGIEDFRILLSEGEGNLNTKCKELMKVGLERV